MKVVIHMLLNDKLMSEILLYLNALAHCNKRLLDIVYILSKRIVALEEQMKKQQGN